MMAGVINLHPTYAVLAMDSVVMSPLDASGVKRLQSVWNDVLWMPSLSNQDQRRGAAVPVQS